MLLAQGRRDVQLFGRAALCLGRAAGGVEARVGRGRSARRELLGGRVQIAASARHECVGAGTGRPLGCGAQVSSRRAYACEHARQVSVCRMQLPNRPATYSLKPTPQQRCPAPGRSASSGGGVRTALRPVDCSAQSGVVASSRRGAWRWQKSASCRPCWVAAAVSRQPTPLGLSPPRVAHPIRP